MKPQWFILTAALLAHSATLPAQTAPENFFSQKPGSDYYLANYSEYEAYLKKLAGESERIKLVDMGKTAEGRTQWMAIISSPANLAKMEYYRGIAQKLAQARGVNEDEARKLSAEGKAIVWIDAGMHATETVTSQGQIQIIHRMLTQNDPETVKMLDECIVLFGHDNPDGMELVSNWYMRHADPKAREFATIPRLYQKYIGHDNNRDSYMMAMPETENVNKILFREWFPQIIYNQHQTGPAGMVVFVPPFRDPFNYNYDPIIISQLNEVGFAMHSRLMTEGKAGSGTRGAARYSTWHNGMERSVAYFHNSIGLLTEIIGGPTPAKIALIPETQLPRGDEPMPIAPRDWHLQDSLDYQWTLNRAVIDYATRNRERLLFNIWRMGMNAIERGSKDNWTTTPSKIDRLTKAGAQSGNDDLTKPVDPSLYSKMLQAPEDRDPRAYIIPADQADLPTAITFLNALIKNGVEVERADASFTVGAKTYPAGSFIVRTAQAYRPHVLDMFEPQDHPHDAEYPGGPPKAPYDITGYTLAYQMGVSFDRILDPIPQSFTSVADVMDTPTGRIEGAGKAGWVVGHETNNSFILTNRLQKAGVAASWMKDAVTVNGKQMSPGAIWIPASARAQKIISDAAEQLGLIVQAVDRAPQGESIALKPIRIGLVDRYGGLMPSGWTRWILEKYEFPFEMLFPQRLDAGNLKKDYDVILFSNDAMPPQGGAWGSYRAAQQPTLKDTPKEYQKMLGTATDAKTLPAVADFVRGGGSVVAIGNSARFIELMGTPLAPALVQKDKKALNTHEFFIPGSVLRARVDNRQPLAYGMPDQVDIFFNRAQTFVPAPNATGYKRVSWFEGKDVLRSGWAIGQDKLDGTIAVADIDVGKGKLFVMGPEITHRAQSYGTFKFLFNALYYGPAQAGK
ncbi:MAG: peptidase [Sphingobium sp.]|nr:peptidase [Sphingobium sp.]